MSIVSADIQIRYSVAAAAGDTTGGTAAGSLGDQVSTSVMADDVTGNLFPPVTGDESLAGVVKYRCVFALNNHSTLTLQNATVKVASQIAGGSTIALGVDNIAASAKGSASAQAATIPNENTAPSGVSAFGLGPIALGNIGPGQVKGIWVRQTTPAGATSPGLDGVDDFYLEIDGDTLP